MLSSFAQWHYRSWWGSSEARLLLIENLYQYPARRPEILAGCAIFLGPSLDRFHYSYKKVVCHGAYTCRLTAFCIIESREVYRVSQKKTDSCTRVPSMHPNAWGSPNLVLKFTYIFFSFHFYLLVNECTYCRPKNLTYIITNLVNDSWCMYSLVYRYVM